MNSVKIADGRIYGAGVAHRGPPVTFVLNGISRQGFEGESIAATLLALGETVFRKTRFGHAPRSLYCGMGVCYDCLVTVNDRENVRACMRPLTAGMVIETVGAEP